VSDVVVHVAAGPAGGDLGGVRSSVAEPFARRAEEIADSLTRIAEGFRARVDAAMADRPPGRWDLDEIQLQFSLALQAESGVIIARTSAETTFTATLTWSARAGAGR
jgi:hypothetical protein